MIKEKPLKKVRKFSNSFGREGGVRGGASASVSNAAGAETERPSLHFHFAPNQFFTNSILTKCYEMKCEPPEDDPFSFEVRIPNKLSMKKHLNCLRRAPRSSSAPAVPLTGRRERT